jgi:hypothetical protein
MILLILAFQVARITGMSPQCPAINEVKLKPKFLKNLRRNIFILIYILEMYKTLSNNS